VPARTDTNSHQGEHGAENKEQKQESYAEKKELGHQAQVVKGPNHQFRKAEQTQRRNERMNKEVEPFLRRPQGKTEKRDQHAEAASGGR